MVNIIVATNKDQLIDHYLIRWKVFVEEQNISLEEEYDFIEKERIVFLVFYNNILVGTARLKLDNNHSKIERVAILKQYRDLGIGKSLINHMVSFCKNHNCKSIHLGAQEYAIGFYEKCGFTKYGEKFFDANIPHYNMKTNLN